MCAGYQIPERCPSDAVARVSKMHFDMAAVYDAKRPIAAHTREAFRSLENEQRPLIIDAGCGTALSTARLAAWFPEYAVVGVDRSRVRLDKAPDNARVLRAELGDFWRLLAKSDLNVKHTFVLYPNPYPKNQHLRRRWHGHPALPWLFASAGLGLTLRSNWRTYLDEFLVASQVTDFVSTQGVRRFHVNDTPLTAFEAKYHRAGLPLYELVLGEPLLL